MKQEATKKIILEKALELFSERGYDAVSVGDIAAATGIKAPSLYNHFKSKQAIFEAIVEETSIRYEKDTDKINIHVQNAPQDFPHFEQIAEAALFEKVRQIFEYSLHDTVVSRFRKMLTIEQFRSPELAALFSGRYVDRMIDYHARIFEDLIAAGELAPENPKTLSLLYVAPIITLLGVCDRQPEREEECLARLENHVRLFFHTYNLKARAAQTPTAPDTQPAPAPAETNKKTQNGQSCPRASEKKGSENK